MASPLSSLLVVGHGSGSNSSGIMNPLADANPNTTNGFSQNPNTTFMSPATTQSIAAASTFIGGSNGSIHGSVINNQVMHQHDFSALAENPHTRVGTVPLISKDDGACSGFANGDNRLQQLDMGNYASSLIHNGVSTHGVNVTHDGTVQTKDKQPNRRMDNWLKAPLAGSMTTHIVGSNATTPATFSPAATGSGPICPWDFLNLNAQPAAPQAKSFAELFKSPSVDIHKPSISNPIVRGEDIVIHINDALYQESLKSFGNALIGRLILSKGS